LEKEKMSYKLVPTILSGGVGSRLWPVSREQHPKPFMRLNDGLSFLQKAFLRGGMLPHVTDLMMVTNREFLFKSEDEFRKLVAMDVFSQSVGKVVTGELLAGDQSMQRSGNASSGVFTNRFSLTFVLEPFGKNTAPAIALACLQAVEKFGRDVLLLVLPADHLIDNQDAFSNAVEKACTLALDGKIVTFGIKPDKPETGYGYIEANDTDLVRFVEKPSLNKAESYVASGNYFWNSGMFCFSAEVMLNELVKHVPEIVEVCKVCFAKASKTAGTQFSQVEILAEDFEDVPSESIDYAVMEKTSVGAVVGCDIGWSDIGNWGAIGELLTRDAQNNRIKGDVVLSESRNCIVHGDERLIAAIGLEDITIIDTPDALLISHNSKAQNVKDMYAHLKGADHKTYKHHETVYRPWGSYTVLSEGANFKMKRIEVEPGASLSLQMHDHRNEHWVVVSGTAKVTNGNEVLFLNVNDSTYIPAGCVHRAENSGSERLVFIEVQTGTYLGEDDIKRFEDIYGRAA